MKPSCLSLSLVTLGLLSTPAAAELPLENPQEARDWYIAMMVANDCAMTQFEIRDALETAFPYNDPALRESGFMAADAGIALVAEGLLTMPGGTFGLVYGGPEC